MPAGWLRGERWADEQIVNATRQTVVNGDRFCELHPAYPVSARYPCEAVSRLFDSVCVGICCLLGLDAAGSGAVSQLVVGLDDEAEQNEATISLNRASILYPSSFRCDCGHESHLCENTVRELTRCWPRRWRAARKSPSRAMTTCWCSSGTEASASSRRGAFWKSSTATHETRRRPDAPPS